MQKFVFILAILFALGSSKVAYAEGGTEDEEVIELDFILIKGDEPSAFSLFQPTAYATLYHKVVTVDLSELPEGATVTISRITTGEEVYSQAGVGSMVIDLNACGKGQYQIDVISGGLWLQGKFRL